MDLENNFDQLVSQAELKIKNDLRKELLNMMLEIEAFLQKYKVPIQEFYNDTTYYTFTACPHKGFPEFANIIRNELVPSLESKYKKDVFSYRPQVWGYIMVLKYGNHTLLKLMNIFYPTGNHIYSLPTYEGDSRFAAKTRYTNRASVRAHKVNKPEPEFSIKSRKILYLHPKFMLEELIFRMYSPAHFDEQNETREIIDDMINHWKKIDYTDNVLKPNKKFLSSGRELFNKIKDIAYEANNDFATFTCIARKKDKAEIAKRFQNYKLMFNSPKSLFDSRLSNMIVKSNNRPVLKIWFLLDYELIPLVDKKAHIYLLLRLIVVDSIIYDIMDVKKIIEMKMGLFNYYLNLLQQMKKEKRVKPIDQCEFVGTNYPNDVYLSDLRQKLIVEQITKSS
ncbi:MAG: hypothetical protein CMM93_06755 [Rickettsiales bacterium]|nr:hypothetical protein [Rickettsiales bacterium]